MFQNTCAKFGVILIVFAEMTVFERQYYIVFETLYVVTEKNTKFQLEWPIQDVFLCKIWKSWVFRYGTTSKVTATTRQSYFLSDWNFPLTRWYIYQRRARAMGRRAGRYTSVGRNELRKKKSNSNIDLKATGRFFLKHIQR